MSSKLVFVRSRSHIPAYPSAPSHRSFLLIRKRMQSILSAKRFVMVSLKPRLSMKRGGWKAGSVGRIVEPVEVVFTRPVNLARPSKSGLRSAWNCTMRASRRCDTRLMHTGKSWPAQRRLGSVKRNWQRRFKKGIWMTTAMMQRWVTSENEKELAKATHAGDMDDDGDDATMGDF
ncbi:hypothetical protein RSAG8_06462, partial [Rhizoctonia solani AG-8 WAC10335]